MLARAATVTAEGRELAPTDAEVEMRGGVWHAAVAEGWAELHGVVVEVVVHGVVVGCVVVVLVAAVEEEVAEGLDAADALR